MKCTIKFVIVLCAVSGCGLLRAQQMPQPGATQTAGATGKPAAQKPPSARARERAEKYYLEGAKALEREDLKAAETNFAHAVELDPGNAQYQASQEIVLEHEATGLIQASDKAKILHHPDEAHADLVEAFRLDPKNPMLAQHLDEIAREAAPDQMQLYPEDESLAPPIVFAPLPGRHSFHLHSNANELIRQVLADYGIAPSFDSSVKNKMARLDADDIDFAEARRMLNLVTDTFFVPLDPKRALVAADTKEKRAEFERLAVETVYFPGLTPAEIAEMVTVAKTVFDAQQATPAPGSSTLTLRAPAPKLAALNATLSEMLDGRSEVQLEVQLYNLAKTRTVNIGVQLPQQITIFNVPTELNSVLGANSSLVQQIISSGLASAGDIAAIAAVLIASGQVSNSILNQPFATFGGGNTLTGIAPGSATANLALNSSDSRALDQMILRVLDQEESTLKSGTRYPIITSSYSSLTGSSLSIPGLSTPGLSSTLSSLGITASALASASTQTIPQVQYEDLGLSLKVKPYVQKDQDITLNLDLTINSLSGTVLNDIPVLDNQEYKAIITLKDGASALVVSSLSKQQSAAVTGLPGLSELPGFQSTTNKNTENDVSSLLILITPHVVRLAHRQEAGRMIVLPVHQ
jgi:general secretion pathway protein D